MTALTLVTVILRLYARSLMFLFPEVNSHICHHVEQHDADCESWLVKREISTDTTLSLRVLAYPKLCCRKDDVVISFRLRMQVFSFLIGQLPEKHQISSIQRFCTRFLYCMRTTIQVLLERRMAFASHTLNCAATTAT